MDIKNTNFNSIAKPESFVRPDGAGKTNSVSNGSGQKVGNNVGPSFEDTLSSAMKGTPLAGANAPAGATAAAAANAVKFSNHAVERMQSRGISFNKGDLERLNQAVDKASAKGSKDTLVLMNDAALIVSVKNKTVVTVMDQAALKENVFTNIDSTIVM